jgi:WD40 repeat protein
MSFALVQDFAAALAAMPEQHPRQRMLALLNEAIRRDAHFVDRHPTALFQCLWNSCWWYDCPAARDYYEFADDGPESKVAPWLTDGPKLHRVVEQWRTDKERATPGFPWVRSLQPPPDHLDASLARVLRGHDSMVASLAYSPDGTLLASGSQDRTVRIWDPADETELACLRDSECWVMSVAWSPEGDRIATASTDGRLRIWDTRTSELLLEWSADRRSLRDVCWSPDGESLLAVNEMGEAHVWSARSGVPSGDFPEAEGGTIWRPVYSPSGDRIAAASDDSTVRIWDAASGRELARFCGHDPEKGVSCLDWSRDGGRLASGSADGTARIWDVANGECLASCAGHEDRIWNIAFSPDGSRIASASNDYTVRTWDGATGRPIACFRGHLDRVKSVAFSIDGRYIASGALDGAIRIWDGEAGGQAPTLTGHAESIRDVVFAPEGDRLATASNDHTIRIWDEQGRPVNCLRGHGAEIEQVAFHSDGRRLASCSADRTVRVWDTIDGAELVSIPSDDQPTCLAYFPDGRLAVGAGVAVFILNDQGEPLDTVTVSSNQADRVAVSADGRLLAVAGNQIVRVVGPGLHVLSNFYATPASVLRLAFTPNGLSVWCRDHTGIYVTDAERTLEQQHGPERAAKLLERLQKDAVRVWGLCSLSFETGAQTKVLEGDGDLAALAAGPKRFPWRAVIRGWFTSIESAETGEPVAWLPRRFSSITTHSAGRMWAGASGKHLGLFILEGAVIS